MDDADLYMDGNSDVEHPDGFAHGSVRQPDPFDRHSVRPDDLIPPIPPPGPRAQTMPLPRDYDDPRQPLPPMHDHDLRSAPGPGHQPAYEARGRQYEAQPTSVLDDPFTNPRAAAEHVDVISDDEDILIQDARIAARQRSEAERASAAPPQPRAESPPPMRHEPLDSQARVRAARRKQQAQHTHYADESPSMLGTAAMVKFLLLAILIVLAIFLLVAVCFVLWSRTLPYRVDLNATEEWSGHARLGQLENGMRYVIVPNQHKPNRFTSYLRVDAGSMDENDDQRGLAHVIEHMSFDNSKTYPGRGGVWAAMTSSGVASFNAFTTFRTTTYELWDMPSTKDGLQKAMNLHQAQVYYSEPKDEFLNQEKGAILGEARMRNGSERLSTEIVLRNHGGETWRPPHRITIGLPDQIKLFKSKDITDFRQKWYRLDRFTLFVVGNVSVDAVEKEIKDSWGPLKLKDGQDQKPAEHPPLGDIKPQGSVFLEELQGINGVEFHLVVTRPYIKHPHTRNRMRQAILDRLISTAFAFQVNVRLAELYPDLILSKFNGRKAGIKIENEYGLGVNAHIMSIHSPGHPHTGTWRRDFEIALSELRRIAEHGIHPSLLHTLLLAAKRMLYAKLEFGSHKDSKKVMEEVLGDMDPDAVYMDPKQEEQMQVPLLDRTFMESAQVYLQSEAQYLWKAYVGILEGKEYRARPYDKFENPTATLQVLVGRSFIKRVEEAMSIDDIRRVIFQAKNSRPPPALTLDRMVLGMMHGVSTGGVSFSGSDAPTGIPEGGTLFSRRRLFERMSRMGRPERADSASGITSFVLNNGVRVNAKPRRSGRAGLPLDPPGKVELQLVSIGGRGTEKPELFGACKAVNEGFPAGYSAVYDREVGRFEASDYDVETVKAYFHGGVPAKTICAEEFFIIEKTLHGGCPADSHCNPLDHSYFKALEGVRLAMNPLYDSRSIRLAATAWDHRLDELLIEQDPGDNLDFHSTGGAWRRSFPNDTRLHEPSAQTIFALDPLGVQQWVREQFTPDRIEVNVVGDFDKEHLIIQLNMVLGTLPNSSYVTDENAARLTNLTARVGYDVYGKDVTPFQRALPTKPLQLGCNLPSAVPDRGWVTAIAPAQNFQEVGDLRFANERLFKEMLFDSMRRDNEFTYLLRTQMHHPLLFPNFGHIAVTWAPGDWPTKPKAVDVTQQNILDSINVLENEFKATMTKELFDKKMTQIINHLETELTSAPAWFVLMRGLSLRPPTIWPQPQPTFLKPYNHSDIVPIVKKLTYDQVKDSINVKAKTGAFIKATLETVDADQPDTCAVLV